MAPGISVRTRASATIVYARYWRIHLPVCHTLRFIAIASMTPLQHVTLLLKHLLLPPDAVALRVFPLARRDKRRAVALLVTQLEGDGNANVDGLGEVDPDLSAYDF